MIYVLRLFEVDAAECAAFTSAFAPGGLWHEIAATISGHVHTQLMQQHGKQYAFLTLEFWQSEEHYRRSRESLLVRALLEWLRSTTREHHCIGVFHFPARGLDEAGGAMAEFGCNKQVA